MLTNWNIYDKLTVDKKKANAQAWTANGINPSNKRNTYVFTSSCIDIDSYI